MPSSDTRGKPQILDFVRNLKHDRMLDIGCGEGTYAALFDKTVTDQEYLADVAKIGVIVSPVDWREAEEIVKEMSRIPLQTKARLRLF